MRALRDGLSHVWVDTCCIDKTSSAELSEAINSMFAWYQDATICYAYLSDVPKAAGTLTDIRNDRELSEEELAEVLQSPFAQSRWLTRGWTLQEFIAPREVKFYNQDWEYIGAKQHLSALLAEITGVDEDVLLHRVDVAEICIARKMSWVAMRNTTRPEDIAYCLLGLFGIQMPLLYGEGPKAFVRLQEELSRISNDQSLFAWGLGDANEQSLFAPRPDCFSNARKMVRWKLLGGVEPWSLTNHGLRISLPFADVEKENASTVQVVVLACRYEDDFSGPIGLRLLRTDERTVFEPSEPDRRLVVVDLAKAFTAETYSIYILRGKRPAGSHMMIGESTENMKCWVRVDQPEEPQDFKAIATFPPRSWNKNTMTMWVRRGNKIRGALHLMNSAGTEIVLVFGYQRSGARSGRTVWSPGWVRLVGHQENKSLEQICDEAGPLPLENLESHATYPLKDKGWIVSAEIRTETIMGEEIYVVQVEFDAAVKIKITPPS